MEKRIIELNEKEIKEKILSKWAGNDDLTSFGFVVEHNSCRTKEHFLFDGIGIKINKIIFEFEEVLKE